MDVCTNNASVQIGTSLSNRTVEEHSHSMVDKATVLPALPMSTPSPCFKGTKQYKP